MNPAACFSLLFLLGATVAKVNAGGVYWTDRGASQLKRMNFDGTSLSTITLSGAVTSPGSNIRGIAVDLADSFLYWADNGNDRLLRANLDGTSSTIVYSIAGGNSFPADIKLDLAGQFLYVCDQLRNRIQRSTLAGANVTDAITNAAATGPYFMDLDIGAGKIYWGDFNDGAIFRANLDGSGRETLLTGNNLTRGVCVEPIEGMLYWINRDDAKVHRCPLSAFGAQPIPLTHPAVQTLYSGLDTPHGLVLDVPARKLYWADTGGNAGTGTGDRSVSRGDFDGSTPLEVLGSGSEPWDVDLDRRCGSYEEWTTRCFRKDAAPEQIELSADPDDDELNNALEYAFDSAPLRADRSREPQAFLALGPSLSAYHPAVKYYRRTGTVDLQYEVEVSTDLTTWSAGGVVAEVVEIDVRPLGDGMEEVSARTVAALTGDTPTIFMRVRVTLALP